MVILAKRDDHVNLSIKPEIVAEFYRHAEKQGIKLSTWVAAKMKEFNEEQRLLEEMRRNKK